MAKHLLLIAALLCAGYVAVATAASPAAPEYSAAYASCMDTNSTTAGMVSCAADETKRQDERLNANYRAAMKTLDKHKSTALRDVQRLWIKYRDANCAFAGSATGGTIDQVNGSGCVLDMTQTRAQELEDLVGP